MKVWRLAGSGAQQFCLCYCRAALVSRNKSQKTIDEREGCAVHATLGWTPGRSDILHPSLYTAGSKRDSPVRSTPARGTETPKATTDGMLKQKTNAGVKMYPEHNIYRNVKKNLFRFFEIIQRKVASDSCLLRLEYYKAL